MTDLLTQRLLAAPDILRTRGFTAAGLLMTFIGAVTTGVLFTDRPLAVAAKWCATVLIALAAVATCFFAAAGLHVPRGEVKPGEEKNHLDKIIFSVASKLKFGTWFASAAAGVALMLTGLLLWMPPSRDAVKIMLTPTGTSAVKGLCPNLGSSFEADIETGQLEKPGPLAMLTVAGKNCGRNAGTVNLTIQREYISAVVAAA